MALPQSMEARGIGELQDSHRVAIDASDQTAIRPLPSPGGPHEYFCQGPHLDGICSRMSSLHGDLGTGTDCAASLRASDSESD